MVAFISKCELPFNFDILLLHWKKQNQKQSWGKDYLPHFYFSNTWKVFYICLWNEWVIIFRDCVNVKKIRNVMFIFWGWFVFSMNCSILSQYLKDGLLSQIIGVCNLCYHLLVILLWTTFLICLTSLKFPIHEMEIIILIWG